VPLRDSIFLLIEKWSFDRNLERRAGIEPANTGFADPRVSHFATGALWKLKRDLEKLDTNWDHEQIKNPPAIWRVGHWVLES
jgi:hypothetical protein